MFEKHLPKEVKIHQPHQEHRGQLERRKAHTNKAEQSVEQARGEPYFHQKTTLTYFPLENYL